MNIKITTITCKRCGHTWVPSKPVVRQCPKCKSAYFDVPRTKEQGKDHA